MRKSGLLSGGIKNVTVFVQVSLSQVFEDVDIALKTAQRFGVRKAICRGAALSALSGDFVLVGQVLSPPRPCFQLAMSRQVSSTTQRL